MRLATLRLGDTTAAAVVREADAVVIEGVPDVGALLKDPQWRTRAADAAGARYPLAELQSIQWAPVVPSPGKIFCVGLNYRAHITEMGRDLPDYPTLFAKFPEALIGAYDPILIPAGSDAVDWEGELAVIIGAEARSLSPEEARQAIAGYAVIDDVTMRDLQYRTAQWLQGKTSEATAPFGPFLVTADEWSPGPRLETRVDGEAVQSARTDDLVFGPAELVSYISHILTLRPGDVIATGTPGGVGHARKPPRYLSDGSVLETSIAGLGSQKNVIATRG